ncbi:hypothetical protein DSCO28_02710 [Desulfosarcina ovata subsp. sediminis]|uniref:Uncharacterized protein n=1 Tax=Desulfosarcina ovata subsp. sediminis TaxID=885957 RepID=A0A5K7ZHG2_9BACT|nr:hypothetical protein [Desulfosarcina ovata]BBO79705.1 hypothetical protein DSCO28_02710 [Desulfosarcina ovata subsp. sediminis]
MVLENQILVKAIQLIYRFIYHGGKIWMNHGIQARVRWLYQKYGITRIEIASCVKYEFIRQRKHRKFNPDKSCLETYVLNFTYFTLLTLVRQCKEHEASGKKAIPFSQFSPDTSIDTMGTSIESLERDGVEGLIDEDDPERILLGKELLEAAVDHFGESDLAVILGLKETRAEAKRLGIKYDTYRKRLQRKLDKFGSILKDDGYDID